MAKGNAGSVKCLLQAIPERIVERRLAAGLTQAQLAAVLGVVPNTVSNWERGIVSPSLETVARLAWALGTTMGYLLGESDDPLPSPRQPRVWTDQDIALFLDAIGAGEMTAAVLALRAARQAAADHDRDDVDPMDQEEETGGV